MERKRALVDASTAFDLKSALFQKQLEFEEERRSGRQRPSTKPKSSADWIRTHTARPKKRKDNTDTFAQVSLQEKGISQEESTAWEKSRAALERKAQLYDSLRLGTADIDHLNAAQRDNLLVDFDRKGWDEERGLFKDEQPKHIKDALEDHEDKVEYIDEFGRTRMISQREADELSNERNATLAAVQSAECEDGKTGLSNGPAHYDESREVRNKGVGFYKFANDEETRKQQMTELGQLRHETVEARTKGLIEREEKRLRREQAIAMRKKKMRELVLEDNLEKKG